MNARRSPRRHPILNPHAPSGRTVFLGYLSSLNPALIYSYLSPPTILVELALICHILHWYTNNVVHTMTLAGSEKEGGGECTRSRIIEEGVAKGGQENRRRSAGASDDGRGDGGLGLGHRLWADYLLLLVQGHAQDETKAARAGRGRLGLQARTAGFEVAERLGAAPSCFIA